MKKYILLLLFVFPLLSMSQPGSGGGYSLACNACRKVDSAWVANHAWLQTGNSISGYKFFGTNNLRSIPILTNGTQRAIYDSLGNYTFSSPSRTFNINQSLFLLDGGTVLRYVDGNEGTGKVMTSDGSGNADWQQNIFDTTVCYPHINVDTIIGCSPVTILDRTNTTQLRINGAQKEFTFSVNNSDYFKGDIDSNRYFLGVPLATNVYNGLNIDLAATNYILGNPITQDAFTYDNLYGDAWIAKGGYPFILLDWNMGQYSLGDLHGYNDTNYVLVDDTSSIIKIKSDTVKFQTFATRTPILLANGTAVQVNLDTLIAASSRDSIRDGYTGVIFTGAAIVNDTIVLPPNPYEGQRILFTINSNGVTFSTIVLSGNGHSVDAGATVNMEYCMQSFIPYTLRYKNGTWY